MTCNAQQQEKEREEKQRVSPKITWGTNSYCMLFNIWKTWWLSAQILSLGCRAWDGNRVVVRLTVRALWVANTLFIRLSVSLFIWLSNYPSQQTAHRQPNANSTVGGGHVWQLVGLRAGHLILESCRLTVNETYVVILEGATCLTEFSLDSLLSAGRNLRHQEVKTNLSVWKTVRRNVSKKKSSNSKGNSWNSCALHHEIEPSSGTVTWTEILIASAYVRKCVCKCVFHLLNAWFHLNIIGLFACHFPLQATVYTRNYTG